MAEFIKVNGQEYPAEVIYLYKDRNWNDRDVRNVFLNLPYDQVVALMPTGTKWSSILKENDVVVEETDMSEFYIAGQVVDYRNGTVSIKMGKPTETEKSSYTVEALMGESITPQRAAELRPMIEQAAKSFTDAEAAKSPELVARWADHIGEVVAPGDRMSDADNDGVLHVYRVNDGHGHTTQADWPPHKTPALWTIIDLEHAGTQDDPIPAARGMEYTYGLYYKDPEDTKLYKCERTGEAAGGKIVLQYLPHELAGQYFTEVSA